MQTSQINNQTNKPAFLLFGLAFRPLFLFAAIFSSLAIAWWVYFWSHPFNWTPYGGAIWWHAHEMIFGFCMAIVTGFLLTAVRTWTGVDGISGRKLLIFVSLWLAARILISINFTISAVLVAIVDVGYLLVATALMAYPVIKVKQWRNLMFVPILTIFALLNGISHWANYSNQNGLSIQVFHAAIILLTLVIAIIGGRVIPMFTANGCGCPKATTILAVELLSLLPIVVIVGFATYGFSKIDANFLFAFSMLAAVANLYRFSRWGFQYTKSNPLVWSLHLSYVFIPLGYFLLALFAFGYITSISAALHSFTIGAIGGMILAMISRVSLGHTGRPLKSFTAISWAYAFIALAAIMRVVIPELLPKYYMLGISFSGILWVIAFGLFGVFFYPILTQARPDGRPH